ncbi:unnamed protein product [Trifolium pratense]|uniref:Uncharacterized protein n=1 Tax=Trifolium pratense TaxID=57577 RepID=A0ACB0LSV1_TRIPR|nr:unnamed protein product [Trifolium pratense]
MGDGDDQHWQQVQRRNRKRKSNPQVTSDIATVKQSKRQQFDNVTTYFFTDFPNSFGAKAMLDAFQYYGDIIEVVFPAKRDRGVTFPIKKVEACWVACKPPNAECPRGCVCVGVAFTFGLICVPPSYKDAVKKIGKNLICQYDAECKNKKIENYCVRFPKADVEYGVCADSISEAQNLIFKIFSKSKLTNDSMPTITT